MWNTRKGLVQARKRYNAVHKRAFRHPNVKRAVGFLKKQKYADVLCNEVDKYRSEYLVVRIHRAQARAKMAKRQHARQRYARKQTRGATK